MENFVTPGIGGVRSDGLTRARAGTVEAMKRAYIYPATKYATRWQEDGYFVVLRDGLAGTSKRAGTIEEANSLKNAWETDTPVGASPTKLESFEPRGAARTQAPRKPRKPRSTAPIAHDFYIVLAMRPDGTVGFFKVGITKEGHGRHGEIRRNGHEPMRVVTHKLRSKRQARRLEKLGCTEARAIFGPSYGAEAFVPEPGMTFEEGAEIAERIFGFALAEYEAE